MQVLGPQSLKTYSDWLTNLEDQGSVSGLQNVAEEGYRTLATTRSAPASGPQTWPPGLPQGLETGQGLYSTAEDTSLLTAS